jgi:hypothetical protein
VNRLAWLMTAAAALALASGTLGPPEPALGEFLEQALRILGR